MTILLAAILLQTGMQSPGTDPSVFGVLLKGGASADLRQGLSSFRADTLTAFPEASYTDDMFTLQASAEVQHLPDSQAIAIKPVSAGAFCRWPGSPWLSAGVFRGLRDPFVYAISGPVVEWNTAGVSELNGVSAEAGGVLGFDGWWNQYDDTLSWYGIKSPWLGFGNVSWEALESDTSKLIAIRGFTDLRAIQPWFSFVSQNDSWSGEGEIRGLSPYSSSSMWLEIVPAARWSKDSTEVEISGLVRGRSAMFSAFLTAATNLDIPEEVCLKAGFDMLSRAGVHWSVVAALDDLDYFSAGVSGMYRASPAGCGIGLNIDDDSVAVTATALYSPVRGVSSVLSVSADLNAGSPDPGCSFGVFASGTAGTAGVQVNWEEGSTVLDLGVSAWID